MAEGISTSLQTCSPILQPYGFQANLELDPLPTSPPSFLHVNDLGLTLPPGSQLEQSTGATQGRDDIYSTSRPSNQEDGLVAGNPHGRDLQFWGDETAFLGDAENLEFADALIDSGFALQLFESSLDSRDSRKRTGDEAFPTEFGFQAQPQKRHAVEQSQTQNIPPPVDTPSLSSPDSSHRPDQAETTPTTPADIDRSQTPDSLFDSLDATLEDFSFPTSALDISPSITTGEAPSSNVNDTEQSVALFHQVTDQENIHQSPPSITDTARQFSSAAQHHDTEYASSYLTKQRFYLSGQDVIANANREMLKRVDPEPTYVSPYPVYGGPLGYLPSSPGIHVKYIKVAHGCTSDRVGDLKKQVQRLTYERDRYKDAWLGCATVDRGTGKSKQQLLQDDNGTLRRLSSHNQTKARMYKQELEDWRTRFYDLARTYNNLLLDIQTRQQSPAVALPPSGYLPQVGSATHFGPRTPAIPQPNPAPPSCSLNPHQGPTRADSVTIDLTEETPSKAANPPETSAISPRGAELLRSYQNKKYNWIGNKNQNSAGSKGLQGHQALSNNGVPQGRRRDSENQAATGLSGGVDASERSDDDFARQMEEELARG